MNNPNFQKHAGYIQTRAGNVSRPKPEIFWNRPNILSNPKIVLCYTIESSIIFMHKKIPNTCLDYYYFFFFGGGDNLPPEIFMSLKSAIKKKCFYLSLQITNPQLAKVSPIGNMNYTIEDITPNWLFSSVSPLMHFCLHPWIANTLTFSYNFGKCEFFLLQTYERLYFLSLSYTKGSIKISWCNN